MVHNFGPGKAGTGLISPWKRPGSLWDSGLPKKPLEGSDPYPSTGPSVAYDPASWQRRRRRHVARLTTKGVRNMDCKNRQLTWRSEMIKKKKVASATMLHRCQRLRKLNQRDVRASA